ncbi:hypothetical protein [Trinickia sp. Y13]|uniref:hypothetical protein n=1 Tax=Trinickia sp. Y13 TaxID=2917807 RepID=UPI002405FBBD|nr:hypothetical protein [Trinickia sp. Y13]MDG0023663.1 hypothetical protein [Trinickia sp. Y13]
MAVSSSNSLLEEAWIAVQFQLAELTAEFGGDIPDIVRDVHDDARAAIEGEYRGLSSMYGGHNDVEVPTYDICTNDEGFQEARGRLVASISFVSSTDFTDEAIAELKALCIAKFAEAAAAHGIPCAFAGIEGWRRFSYTEQVVIETA